MNVCVYAYNIVSKAFTDGPSCRISLILAPPSKWPTGRKLPQTGSQPLPFPEGDLELNVFLFSLNHKKERQWNVYDIALSFYAFKLCV